MRTNDYYSRQFITDLLNNSGLCNFYSASTFDEENGGADCVAYSSNTPHSIEIKIQNKVIDKMWDASLTGVSFDNVPERTSTNFSFINTFRKEISTLYKWAEKGKVPENLQNGEKFFIYNADRNSDGEFLWKCEDDRYNCKWLKIHKKKMDQLLIFQDGILFIPYLCCRRNFIGYCRFYERNVQSSQAVFGQKDEKYRWAIKAMVKVDVNQLKEKGTADGMLWFPIEKYPIPENVYGNNR